MYDLGIDGNIQNNQINYGESELNNTGYGRQSLRMFKGSNIVIERNRFLIKEIQQFFLSLEFYLMYI